MAAKINWHRYEAKLRHCHPMYSIENAIHENEHWYTRVWENFGDNGIRA